MHEKNDQKTNWCKNGKYKTTFFVEATKNQELAKECQRILDDADLGVKVVEKNRRIHKIETSQIRSF